MRSLALAAAFALGVLAPAAAQDLDPEQRFFGADTLFGPGVIDLAPTGSAVRLRLRRPAHVLALELSDAGAARVVLPRGARTRLQRAGDSWLDMPLPVAAAGGSATTATFTRGRVNVVGQAPPARPPDRNAAPTPGATGTAVLVLVSDSAWQRDAVRPLLPSAPSRDLLVQAMELVAALTDGRSDHWAAYFARW
jgi:hypothetical protein